jgi:hypothetical protein
MATWWSEDREIQDRFEFEFMRPAQRPRAVIEIHFKDVRCTNINCAACGAP